MTSYTSYNIHPALRLILTNFQGTIQISDVTQMTLKFINDKEYDASYDLIMDFRDSIAFGFKLDLMDYIEFFKKSISLKNRIQVGIMYSTPNQKFLLSIYKPIASLLKMDVGDFEKIDSCLQWMGYTENDQLLIKESLEKMKYKPSEEEDSNADQKE